MRNCPSEAWPTVRAYSTAPAVSRPSVLTRATSSPVAASFTSVTFCGSSGRHHWPLTKLGRICGALVSGAWVWVLTLGPPGVEAVAERSVSIWTRIT